MNINERGQSPGCLAVCPNKDLPQVIEAERFIQTFLINWFGCIAISHVHSVLKLQFEVNASKFQCHYTRKQWRKKSHMAFVCVTLTRSRVCCIYPHMYCIWALQDCKTFPVSAFRCPWKQNQIMHEKLQFTHPFWCLCNEKNYKKLILAPRSFLIIMLSWKPSICAGNETLHMAVNTCGRTECEVPWKSSKSSVSS